MAIKTFTTGEVLTASDTNTYLANSGLVFIKQETVGSGVTTVNITSCFNNSYDNYVVAFNNISCSGGASLGITLLSGSTPVTTNWSATEFYIPVGTTVQGSQLSAPGGAYAYCAAGAAASGLAGSMEINSPYLARYTNFSYTTVASDYYRWGFGIHTLNNSYDGVRYTAIGGATLTGGSITVYGRRKQ